MLHDPARHEALLAPAWSEPRALDTIRQIVDGLEREFVEGRGWRVHPQDEPRSPDEPSPSLYYGATGVIWALRYLRDVGAAAPGRGDGLGTARLLELTDEWLAEDAGRERASYLMGHTPILMLEHAQRPTIDTADALAALIAGNVEHPARELMWGSPGTMLAALFLHRRTGEDRWAALYRESASRLAGQLLWSDERGCHYWTQDLYGRCSTYIDAVHGFVATAAVLIAGRHLLPDWPQWQQRVARTVTATAVREDGCASWPPTLDAPAGSKDRKLMQYCHGAPGFVVCLGGFPGAELDALLLEAGEATWRAGPLAKGSNLCHDTAGNGYAFLALHRRTGDERWLARARAFAMHAIGQFETARERHGMLRASLWTGDPGLAIYLWDCVRGTGAFPTLEVFDGR